MVDLDRINQWIGVLARLCGIGITSALIIGDSWFNIPVSYTEYVIAALLTGLPIEKIISAAKKKP